VTLYELRTSRGWPTCAPSWSAATAGCPLLVSSLLAAGRPEPIRYLGLARTVMAGSEPVDREDAVSRLLDSVNPA
jgi:hypothetical protein